MTSSQTDAMIQGGMAAATALMLSKSFGARTSTQLLLAVATGGITYGLLEKNRASSDVAIGPAQVEQPPSYNPLTNSWSASPTSGLGPSGRRMRWRV